MLFENCKNLLNYLLTSYGNTGFSLVRENLVNLEKALIFEKVRENLEKVWEFYKIL